MYRINWSVRTQRVATSGDSQSLESMHAHSHVHVYTIFISCIFNKNLLNKTESLESMHAHSHVHVYTIFISCIFNKNLLNKTESLESMHAHTYTYTLSYILAHIITRTHSTILHILFCDDVTLRTCIYNPCKSQWCDTTALYTIYRQAYKLRLLKCRTNNYSNITHAHIIARLQESRRGSQEPMSI